MFCVVLKSVLASNRYLGFGFLCFVLVGVLWVGWFGLFPPSLAAWLQTTLWEYLMYRLVSLCYWDACIACQG